MPWTFAHPAAILPLRRLCPRWLSLPALILGAMAPDVSYYIGMHGRWRAFCHTAEGILIACLPLCLLLLALLLRFGKPLTVLLPEPHRGLVRAQLQPSPHEARRAWAVAALSVLIGAATHVLWDSLSHQALSVPPWMAEPDDPALEAVDGPFQASQLLQHLNTVIGVTLLAWRYRRALRQQPPLAPAALDAPRRRLLMACLVVAFVVGATAAWLLTPDAIAPRRFVRTLVWSTSCFAALYVVASTAWWRRHGNA